VGSGGWAGHFTDSERRLTVSNEATQFSDFGAVFYDIAKIWFICMEFGSHKVTQ
jgi:hypothetical protein